MIYTLQIHRTGDAPHVWAQLGQHADANVLADRARAMVALWRLRKLDFAHDAARVIDSEGRQTTRFDVEHRRTWSNQFRKGRRSIGQQSEEVH